MNGILRVSVAAAAVCMLGVLGAAGQPKFEVASVKRAEMGIIKNSMGPGTVTLIGDPLKIVIREAFQMKDYQISGPSWLDESCYEIVAKMPEGATSDQIPAMLQALLAERFKFTAHKESRPQPVYALVVGKGGARLQEASANFRSMGQRTGVIMFRAGAANHGIKGAMTLARLAGLLANQLGRPVQDLTGLTGTYDIDLSWAPDPTIERPGRFSSLPQTGPADGGANLPAAPTASIFTAIQDSLGLKLEARTGPGEVLVIDHVERVPVEN